VRIQQAEAKRPITSQMPVCENAAASPIKRTYARAKIRFFEPFSAKFVTFPEHSYILSVTCDQAEKVRTFWAL
jgi:hypothetical protein